MEEKPKEGEHERPVVFPEEEQGSKLFRMMSGVIVVMAIAGFFALAWYAYKSGGESVQDKDVELVKADQAPVKEAPANPGGMQIPNQDKTVYGLMGGSKSEKPVVERLMPPPETPVARNDDTETWMSDTAKNKSGAGEEQQASADSPPESEGIPASAGEAVLPPPSANDHNKAATVMQPPTPPAPVKTVAPQKPTPAVQPVQEEAEAGSESEARAPAAVAPASAPPSKPLRGMVAQLGAYASEAEAEENWKRISGKFSDQMDGKDHRIVRADVPGKGVFYRLQVLSFASAKDAETFCHTLQGQGCFPAKAK